MPSRAFSSGADVLVIGAGAAGLIAAIEAADVGARVIVVESEDRCGGSTRLSAGYVALCETALEPGDREEFYADLMESHRHDCDESLSRLYVDRAAETHARLNALGIAFTRTYQFAHMRKPWGHELPGKKLHGGAEIAAKLEEAARGRGVDIRLAHRARKLIRGENGRVVGALVESKGGELAIHAEKGLVIASGGFTRNPDLIRNFGRPGADKIVPITGPGSRGDGLVMGMALGAATSYLCAGVQPTGPADPLTGTGAMLVYSGAILLNREGKRFVRESKVYLDLSWAGLAQTDASMIQIYDSAMRADHLSTMMGKVLTGYREYVDDTLDGLTRQLATAGGLDAEAALATIERYNGHAAAGADPDFGRTHMVGVSRPIKPIAEPPFYGILTAPGTTHFNGGLKIDNAMRVIDLYGDAIPGLYAAGEVTGGFHGVGYLSATCVGMALIFGRIAGQSAAQA